MNRKREGALTRSLPLVQGVLICAAVATIGFGYVWQKNSIYKLGDDIKLYEQQLEAMRKKNEVLLDQVARLKSPRVLEAKCKTWNLGLGVPKESQIVRVPEPAAAAGVFPGELAANRDFARGHEVSRLE